MNISKRETIYQHRSFVQIYVASKGSDILKLIKLMGVHIIEQDEKEQDLNSSATKLTEAKSSFSEEVIENTKKAVERLINSLEEAAKKESLDCGTSIKPLVDMLDEAHGNFGGIFGRDKLPFDKFVRALASDPSLEVKAVDPLEYFINVGNTASSDQMKAEIERLPGHIKQLDNPKERAKALIESIQASSENHLGVDQEMYERDLAKGKDHDATMVYLLTQIAEGKVLPPGFVGVYSGAEEKLGKGVTRVSLDGTHKAMACAATNSPYLVIEVNLDKLI